METPKIYKELVQEKIITAKIVASVIYSLNKRAKNWRDKNPQEYKKAKRIRNLNLLDKNALYDDRVERYKVLEYYKKKDYIMLSLLKPDMIHLINGVEYLHFSVHKSDYHMPNYIYELYGYGPPRELNYKEVNDFSTMGENIDSLLSVQFCNMVIDLIRSNDYMFINGAVAIHPGKLENDR